MAHTTPRPFSATAAAALSPRDTAKSFDLSAVSATQIGRLSEDQLRHCSEAIYFFTMKLSSLQTIHNEFQILEQQVLWEATVLFTHAICMHIMLQFSFVIWEISRRLSELTSVGYAFSMNEIDGGSWVECSLDSFDGGMKFLC